MNTALSHGTRIGRYKIESKLGAGGMGEVYLAEDTQLGRQVALKLLPENLTDNKERLSRFKQEARATSTLNHPNILTIHEIGQEGGLHFIATEFIDGVTLRQRMQSTHMKIVEVLDMMVQVASALSAAHEAGIVHRDIKPENIMVRKDGYIKMLDFGLAKLTEPQAAGSEASTWVQTDPGVVMGTAQYLSPEQARGLPVDARSDIFNLGVVLYEMIANRAPFEGTTKSEVIAAILEREPQPLARFAREVPVELERIVTKALAKDREERYQTAKDFSIDLRKLKRQIEFEIDRERSSHLADAFRRDAASGGSPEVEEATTRVFSVPVSSLARQQDIRFCVAADGVSLAYSLIGTGPLLVRVLGHFTHLEVEWEWPDLRYFWERLAEHYTVVRYDGRGIGLSDRYTGEFTEETRQLDLDAVLTAIGAKNMILLGISEGGWTAATYATQHPERISHLVLYGAYCRGARARPGYDAEEDQALVTLIRKGWGRNTPAFRQIITSQFFRPDADPKLIAHFNEMQRASADPETAARYHQSCHVRGDGRDLFRQVRVPTLVVHCRDDMAVSAEEGRLLASLIPGAHLVLLPSGTHYFPTDREVVTKVVGAINRFVDVGEEQ